MSTTALRRGLIALAFLAVLLQPGYGERDGVRHVADVEVMVVLDRTRSMAAYDGSEGRPRIRDAQRDLRRLTEQLPETRFSLITWASEARTVLPFTTDHAAFHNALDVVHVEGAYDGTGSNIGTPLRDLVAALKQAEEQHPERARMLVFASDGENTAGGEPESYERVAPYVDGGFVLGYGTPDGAPMPLADDLTESQGFVPFEGGQAISRADHDALRALAEQTGTEFVARSAPGGIKKLADAFSGDLVEQADGSLPAEHDLTWVAGLLLVGLLLWELYDHWRAVWTTPRSLGVRRQPREEAKA